MRAEVTGGLPGCPLRFRAPDGAPEHTPRSARGSRPPSPAPRPPAKTPPRALSTTNCAVGRVGEDRVDPLRLAVRRALMRAGSADVPEHSAVVRSVGGIVSPGLGEAEPTVGATTALVGVMVVLSVVFPEAHGADLEVATSLKRQVPATRTCVRLASRRPIHVDEHAGNCRARSALLITTLPGLPDSSGRRPLDSLAFAESSRSDGEHNRTDPSGGCSRANGAQPVTDGFARECPSGLGGVWGTTGFPSSARSTDPRTDRDDCILGHHERAPGGSTICSTTVHDSAVSAPVRAGALRPSGTPAWQDRHRTHSTYIPEPVGRVASGCTWEVTENANGLRPSTLFRGYFSRCGGCGFESA